MSRQPTPGRKAKTAEAAAAKPQESSGARSFVDELIFLCVIVMFFRMFVVEIYKIPSGSMTPTLLGGRVAQIDVDQDGTKELLFFDPSSVVGETQPLVYKWNGERYIFSQRLAPVPPEVLFSWNRDRLIYEQFDRILVSKIPYMFHPPRRGDIVVFKVPETIFKADASIYIKRAAGLPGEVITFAPTGRLVIDGRIVEQPDFYKTQLYGSNIDPRSDSFRGQPEISYLPVGEELRLQRIVVPPGKIYVFGDNTHGSADSRYWGGVPIPNIKGQAFMRIWPITQLKFLR
ncbi:MAG: signal peptidase I [Candidatus Sumerlaeia bacterium]